MKKQSGWLAGVVALGLVAASARADMVTVGSPGNTGELSGAGAGGYGPDAICGAVAYSYQIGEFEVRAGEWCGFLNAVDPTGANALGLYNANMDSSYGCQITQHAGGLYDFSGRPSGAESDWTERPVNYVSWYDAARYCNWLTTGSTETGVYDTSAAGWGSSNAGDFTAIMDHQAAAALYGTAYFIPTEDEWYKAAYYDPVAGVYYDYPTGSNTAPTSEAPPGGSNSANYYGSTWAVGSPYYRSNVGAYSSSESPFMTYDQGGNVWEWNETLISSSYRGLRGGSFSVSVGNLRADLRVYNNPALEYYDLGFRVASLSVVPEPGSLGLLAFAGLLGLKRRRRLGR